MSKTSWHIALFVLAMFTLLPVAASAQEQKSSNPQAIPSEGAKNAKAPSKLPLQSLTLINIDQDVRKVAEEASARSKASKTTTQAPTQKGSAQPAEGAVLEFKPTDNAFGTAADPGTFQVKTHKKSVLKNIHGSAYGATASALGNANTESGAVGADSGNGKFNVYVEGEHSQANTPAPH